MSTEVDNEEEVETTETEATVIEHGGYSFTVSEFGGRAPEFMRGLAVPTPKFASLEDAINFFGAVQENVEKDRGSKVDTDPEKVILELLNQKYDHLLKTKAKGQLPGDPDQREGWVKKTFGNTPEGEPKLLLSPEDVMKWLPGLRETKSTTDKFIGSVKKQMENATPEEKAKLRAAILAQLGLD